MSSKLNRPLSERIADRLWVEYCEWRQDPEVVPGKAGADGSVSGRMDWPGACRALAVDGCWSSRGFRRRKSVREVVETLGVTDGRFFAAWLARHGPEWLRDERVIAAAAWGDPIRAPGICLGTTESWSPASLRYLAHAVWLKKEGYLREGGTVVEVGVGFGGLAAMLALVAGARVILVDLPEVEAVARLQMRELGLEAHCVSREAGVIPDLFLSNYAFTELSAEWQDRYIAEFARRAGHGVVLSNAAVFAGGTGGRTDAELLARLGLEHGEVREWPEAGILGPSDRMCGNTVLAWQPAGPPIHQTEKA